MFYIVNYFSIVWSRAKGDLDRGELMFFLTGGIGLENTVPNPDSQWLGDRNWDEICRMDQLPNFKGFL